MWADLGSKEITKNSRTQIVLKEKMRPFQIFQPKSTRCALYLCQLFWIAFTFCSQHLLHHIMLNYGCISKIIKKNLSYLYRCQSAMYTNYPSNHNLLPLCISSLPSDHGPGAIFCNRAYLSCSRSCFLRDKDYGF